MDREVESSLGLAVAQARFETPGTADHVLTLIAGNEPEEALAVIERDVEGEQEALLWLHLSAAAKALDLGERAETYRRRYAEVNLVEAIAAGRFSDPSIASHARRLLDASSVEQAFDLLEGAADNDQDSGFWISMEMAAASYGLRERATRYLYRYAGTPKHSGPPPEERAIKSTLSVSEGMAQVIDFYADYQPHPDWQRFRSLDIEEDLHHLKQWFESLLSREPPGPEVTGLWFGLGNPYRAGKPTADLYVRGATYDYDDEDWIHRTRWYPAGSEARSRVLDSIYRIAYPQFGATGDSTPEVQDAYCEALEHLLGNTAEYSLGFAYAGLVVRWLAEEVDRELFLADATERVLFTGFDDGDWLCVGALRPSGLVLSKDSERMA